MNRFIDPDKKRLDEKLENSAWASHPEYPDLVNIDGHWVHKERGELQSPDKAIHDQVYQFQHPSFDKKKSKFEDWIGRLFFESGRQVNETRMEAAMRQLSKEWGMTDDERKEFEKNYGDNLQHLSDQRDVKNYFQNKANMVIGNILNSLNRGQSFEYVKSSLMDAPMRDLFRGYGDYEKFIDDVFDQLKLIYPSFENASLNKRRNLS